MSRLNLYLEQTVRAVAFVVISMWAFSAHAETVEVAKGIQVTKRSYAAPASEQPFHGFAPKNSEQTAADANFVNAIIQAAGTREKAYDETIKRAWRAVAAGRMGEAGQRFNQAFLISPEQSSNYHGFAIVAQIRFRDLAAAEELFGIALRQPNPTKALNTDYGRLLLILKRPRDALPVLDQAVKDAPDAGDAWTYLAVARFQNGDKASACAAAEEAGKRRPANNSGNDLTALRRDAQCN